jgi:serpin B
MSMLLVVPRAKDGLAAVEQNLSTATLDGWLAGLRREEVDLQLPKFKIEQKLALKPMLSAMGMPRAFSQAAEFGGISASDELELTEVVHQAFMEVDEKGTEAAAATAAVVGVRSAIGPAPAEPKFVRADHPFWLAIRHQPSGALVFAGRCTRPAK